MSKCTYCGKEYADGVTRCLFDGYSVTADGRPLPAAIEPPSLPAGAINISRSLWTAAVVFVVLVVAFLVVFVLAAQRSVTGIVTLNRLAPFLLPSSQLARNIAGADSNLQRESLSILAGRKDPGAVERAIELLRSDDDYVWLNAAHYVGAVNRPEAVPYLIKALRHTAWRSDNERLSYLSQITGENFGTDFKAWSNWWTVANPGASFDFEQNLGSRPRR